MEWRLVVQFGPPPAADDGMSGLAIFSIVVCCIVTYTFISAICQRICVGTDDEAPIGLAWPLVLPWLAGEYIFDRLNRSKSNLPKAKINEGGVG